MLFRLRRQDGQQQIAEVILEPGKTMGGYLWISTPEQVTKNNKFTGTVEYEGKPGRTWEFSSRDPTARYTRIDPNTGFVSLMEYRRRGYYNGVVEVRLGKNDVQAFRAYMAIDD